MTHPAAQDPEPVLVPPTPMVLISTPVARIVTFWRPGSHDWSWADEYRNLIDEDERGVTARILARVDSEGIDFADQFGPVMLGSDGRVWDGHHRICIAIRRGVHSLMCEVVEAKGGDQR